ncbi:lysylphosphatidylglycerol synthase domain-containing protein [Thalassobellus suaedae]|uniref:Lysylphosphatidylglycerol synthase domain-containing protein n=1 Tax=Thalassobellus suaedae TaxID=3074124 RepID=A0ABY9XQL9_9FLAO|nr:lysylphosphatidylglycerol synthase domain-containing protein [Flavobacteriaceae bacterium HL-DH14]
MMYSLPYKTKQFFFVLIKLSIVVAAFYFIYQKLTKNSELQFSVFIDFLTKNDAFSIKNIVFILILSFLNWFFEILKWQNLVFPIKKITFKNASEQSLGSLTASLFTPNRIGEYGAKAIYYTSNYRKRIMLINLISNLLQMSITVILGIIGLSIFISNFNININLNNLLIILISSIVFITLITFGIRKNKFTIKGVSFEKIKDFISNFPKNKIRLGWLLSLLRYGVFSFQFYFLFHVFKTEITYLNAMTAITSMYLLASIIPSVFIFDVIIKGSIAVYLFAFLGINELTILSIITIMWMLNFVLPSIYGSYYVLNFKLPKNDN